MSLTEESIVIQRVANFIREFCKWSRYSSTQKLIIIIVAGAFTAVLLGQYGLFVLLIISIVLTIKATNWMLSIDVSRSDTEPLAQRLEKLFKFIETLKAIKHRIQNSESHEPCTELRARSESIASPAIPDLDVDGESSFSGVFNKAIRLELNSIALLIIRDFVHIWYHKFSYNPQFPKDSRVFLFKAIHNVVERISRLSAHETVSELVDSYQQHLVSFYMCVEESQPEKSTYNDGKDEMDHDWWTVAEKVFQEKFQLHYALESAESERQYLHAVTKVILMGTCAKDVMSTRSTVIFLTEVLSMNVVLPVMEMLSTPDRLYELLIRLTYNGDNVILSDDVMRQLIDDEVNKVKSQLHFSSSQKGTETPHMESLDSKSDTMKLESNKYVECAAGRQPVSSQGFSQEDKSSEENSKKNISETKSLQLIVRKTKTSKDSESRSVPDGKESTKVAQENEAIKGSPVFTTLDSTSVMTDQCPSNINSITDTTVLTPSVVSDVTGVDDSKNETSNGTLDLAKSAQESVESSAVLGGSGEYSEQRQNIYGEIVTTVPALGPKLRAFKDLFRPKKSKQQQAEKVEMASEMRMEQEGQEETSKASSDNISSVHRLKSLRLSPLLTRSNKFLDFGSKQDKNVQQSLVMQAAEDKTDVRDPSSDSLSSETEREQGKHSPGTLTTPSPTQLIKFFQRIRKGPAEPKKTSLSPAEVKSLGSPPADLENNAFSFSSLDSTASCAVSTDQSGTGLVVPSVQVTDESDKHEDDNVSSSGLNSSPFYSVISVSSYDAMPTESGSKEDQKNRSVAFDLDGEGEESTEISDGRSGPSLDSSFIFQDISIAWTMTCQEFRSNSQFTLYQIEYEALHFSDTGIPVLRTGSVKRRYREFVNLMLRLEDNSAYKKLLKDIKGPKRWVSLPFKNMDKENISIRQKTLEQFLKALIQVEAVCNGPELREFLAYEGDSHIAFVRRATEINVPRLDKMLVKTMSGVFDKLKNLPSLPQEVISGIRGRDSTADKKDDARLLRDADGIVLATEFSQQMPHSNLIKDFCEKFVGDVQLEGLIPRSPASPLTLLLQDESLNLSDHMLAQVPRLDSSGAESPDQEACATEGDSGTGNSAEGLTMYDAGVGLLVQLLPSQHWLCHERVMRGMHNLLGRKIDRWLRNSVSSLTTEERCLYYIRLLRENVWPGGTFMSGERTEKSVEEKLATKAAAKRLLLEFFPGVVQHLLGTESVDSAVDKFLGSFQNRKLNKHFLYSSLDKLLEKLFPEMLDPSFQSRVLT